MYLKPWMEFKLDLVVYILSVMYQYNIFLRYWSHERMIKNTVSIKMCGAVLVQPRGGILSRDVTGYIRITLGIEKLLSPMQYN
jgi:hypothetical protein